MDLSIIYVNYKTSNYIINSINSVLKYSEGFDYEVIVVDNNSNDNSKEILTKTFGEKIKYIQLGENIGFGRANNEGMKIAKGRNFLCFNPDTLLEDNSLKTLVDFIDSDQNIGLVGPNLYYEDHTPQASYRLHFNSLTDKLKILFGICYFSRKWKEVFNYTQTPKIVSVVFGACFMIKRGVYEKLGGFDPRFFMYAEEEEFCLRIKRGGYRAYNLPTANVLHLEGKSFVATENRIKRMNEGEKTYYNVCFTPLTVKLIIFVDKLIALSRLAIFSILRNKKEIEFWKIKIKNL